MGLDQGDEGECLMPKTYSFGRCFDAIAGAEVSGHIVKDMRWEMSHQTMVDIVNHTYPFNDGRQPTKEVSGCSFMGMEVLICDEMQPGTWALVDSETAAALRRGNFVRDTYMEGSGDG